MLNRLVRFTLVGLFATALAGYGVSYAQEDDDDDTDAEMMGDEGSADEGGGDVDTTDEGTATEGEGTEATEEGSETENAAPAAAPGAYPAEEIPRPIQLYKGMFEAGVDIPIPNDGDSIGNYVGVTLRADYGVSDKIQAGVRIPLAIIKQDNAETLGGLVLDGRYALITKPDMMLSAGTGISYGYMGLYPITVFAPPAFLDADGMKLGFSPGVNFKKVMDKLAITADPALVLVMDGVLNADLELEMFQALFIPVAVQYQVNPTIAAGVRTGLYSGHKFKFSADDGLKVPLILEGQYTMMEGKMDVGAQFGFGSLLNPEGTGIGDTLFIGLFANYRNK